MLGLFINTFKISKLKTIVYILLSFIGAISNFIPIIITYYLYDKIESYFLGENTILICIFWMIFYYVVLFLNYFVFNQLKSVVSRSIKIDVNNLIKNDYYNKFKKIPFEMYEDEVSFSNLCFIRDNVCPSLINNSLLCVDFFCSILTFAFMIAYLSTIHYLLIAVALIISIPYIFINRKFSLNNYYNEYRKLKEIRQTNYLYYLLTNKDNKKEMITDNSYVFFSNMWSNNYDSINKAAIQIRKKTTYVTAIYDFVYALIQVSSILLFFKLSKDIEFGNSIFLSLVMTFNNISSCLLALSFYFSNYKITKINIEKYEEFKNNKEEDSSLIENVKTIKLNKINYKYPSNTKNTLYNITYTFEKGKKYAFIGENGSGKSTLAKVISGILHPSDGEITINGMKSIDYKCKISYVMQNGYKYETTILENITYGCGSDIINFERINEILDFLGLKQYVDSLPKGLLTQLGELEDDSSFLSGGQWQKISIARALYNEQNEIIVFDEPTSAMDPISENNFISNISKYIENKIIIFITHHLKITSLVDEILYIENGLIKEAGTHNQLVLKKGKYYDLYNYEVGMIKKE